MPRARDARGVASVVDAATSLGTASTRAAHRGAFAAARGDARRWSIVARDRGVARARETGGDARARARGTETRAASGTRGFAASGTTKTTTTTTTTMRTWNGWCELRVGRAGEGRRAREAWTVTARRGFAAEPLKESAAEDEPTEEVKVDIAALDRARAEISKLHRERQLKAWERMYASAVGGVTYAASFGPWFVSLSKMSRAEWKSGIKHSWGHVKDEMHHYWSGAKLLWVEVKIASRLSWRLMSGSELSRRERKQLTRTTADVFRLVPFAAFVLIPFMEVFLPVALKLFPNMLPTTFRNDLKHEEELKKKLKAKLEVARFLQDTVRMMAKGLKHSRDGVTRDRADDLYVFMKKIRSGAKGRTKTF